MLYRSDVDMSKSVSLGMSCGQVEVDNAELYQYDGEALAKSEELGKPGLVTIKERQVSAQLTSVYICHAPSPILWFSLSRVCIIMCIERITVRLKAVQPKAHMSHDVVVEQTDNQPGSICSYSACFV